MTDTKSSKLILNILSKEQYDSATKSEDELYLTPDTGEYVTTDQLSNYVTSDQLSNYATTEQLSTKQDTLTTGSNISITNNTIAVTGSEDWTFTLTDGTSVVKKVVVQ